MLSGPLLVSAGALIISTAPVFFALSGAEPSVGALLRFAYALPPLLLLCALRPTARASFGRQGWLALGVASGAFFAADMLTWHRSIALIGAGPATLLANTQVLWITLFGVAFLAERPGRGFWLALPVLAVGMLLLCGVTPSGFARASDGPGLAYGAASGAMYAGALLCLRQAQRSARIAPEAALVVQLSAALCAVAAAAWLGGESLDLEPQQHGWLLALAWGPQVLGWLCISAGIRRAPAYQGGVLLLLQPVGSLLLGWWVLAQALTPGRWIGAALVLGGVAASLAAARR